MAKFKQEPNVELGNPYHVQIHLLNSCINDCSYCYLKASRANSILKSNRIKSFLNKLEKYNAKYKLNISITLTGGDLFLYPELETLFKYLNKSNNIISVSLLLNSLWHKKSKYLISIIANKIDNVQLNLDNVKDRPQDLRWLEENNIPFSTKILLSKDNSYYKKQKNSLKNLIKNHPELCISVDRFIPTNKNQIRDLCSHKELQKKLSDISQLAKGTFISDDPVVKILLNQKIHYKKNTIHGCSIGNGSVTVYPNGSIKLCARIPKLETGFTIDNFDLYKYIEFTNKLKASIKTDCIKCTKYKFCQGGCPATSFFQNNKLSKDINCFYEKDKITN